MKIALLGTRGVPASYSGFETCVEQLGQRLVERGHQVTGLLVNPNHPDEMAAAIIYLIDNPIKRKEMGRSGRERLQQEFSLDAFIANWHHLYESVTIGQV